jgi:DNA-binding GntR family transcriptional regulator
MEMSMAQVKRPPTLTSTVKDAIRESILRGEFLPGKSLQEELSQSLNISRSTIREALHQLQNEGLVDIVSYRGAFVTRLTVDKVREIYTFRGLVEPYAVRLALENHKYSEDDLQGLRTLISMMAKHEAEGNYSEMIRADMNFHHLITKVCGHELLLNVINSLQSQTLLFILNTKLYKSDMVSDDASHNAILESVRSGNPAFAEQVLRQHITDAGSSLLSRMVETN